MSQPTSGQSGRWYSEVTSYHWLVLAIASAGWIFDVFEGQLFNITRSQLLPEVLGVGVEHGSVKFYGDLFLGVFLVGGTVGGLGFGMLADRIGRRPTMMITILMYSVFSGLTCFAQSWWHVGVLRFLVAMGVGGEWAVAASLVAEVFPARARAQASGIFHASSVFGTWGATLAGLAVGAQWRYAYLIGILPALLVLWVRASVRESETWQAAGRRAADEPGVEMGSVKELLTSQPWAARALLGMALAAVGLATFWSVTIAGQDLTRELIIRNGLLFQSSALSDDRLREGAAPEPLLAEFRNRGLSLSAQAEVSVEEPGAQWRLRDGHSAYVIVSEEGGPIRVYRDGAAPKQAQQKAKFAYGLIQTAGGGLGLLAFGPLSVLIGRRWAFAFMHIGALLIVPVACYLPATYTQQLMILPLFGFLTLGMHAGYAVYFPELFPTHLRATGTGFCFNVGRIVAAPMLVFSGWFKALPGMDLRQAVTLLGLLFALGLVLLLFLPETKGKPLPE